MEKRSGSSDGSIINDKSKKHRRKNITESENQDEGIEEQNPVEYIREQQLKLDFEREQIMKNSTMIEEVKIFFV